MSEQLISTYNMEIASPACTPGASWWSVKITLDNDISEVLPYLNAELDETDYHHNEKVLLWDSDRGFLCAFRPYEITIAPVENRDVAQTLCDEVIDLVCNVWSRRHEIEPDYTGETPPPSILQILKLLPRTNCKECGSLTCMAFAAVLSQRRIGLEACEHLSGENRARLSKLLEQ